MSEELQTPETEQFTAEDGARADCYALIGRLFYDAPDAGLLSAISHVDPAAEAPGATAGFAPAWSGLRIACGSADAESVRIEYDRLFIGVGKAAVTLYTSRYIGDSAADKHLVRLREHLDGLGLARRDSVFEVEDHVSGLCDVMRHLIENNQPLEEQRRFFEIFVRTGALPLCNAVETAEPAVFYKQVAAFARAFFEMEKQAFEMED